MSRRPQAEKAENLRHLHHAGIPLVLPNIWNPIGARILEAKGYPAVATASAALSASLGYQDTDLLVGPLAAVTWEPLYPPLGFPTTVSLSLRQCVVT